MLSSGINLTVTGIGCVFSCTCILGCHRWLYRLQLRWCGSIHCDRAWYVVRQWWGDFGWMGRCVWHRRFEGGGGIVLLGIINKAVDPGVIDGDGGVWYTCS